MALWSGLDTLSARDKYVDAPTKDGYDKGVSRQRRTGSPVVPRQADPLHEQPGPIEDQRLHVGGGKALGLTAAARKKELC